MAPETPRPGVLVSTLLEAKDLRLRLVNAPENLDDLVVEWTSATELIDPARFIEGTELMLITGEELDPDDSEAIRDYVGRLADRGIEAIGFAVGLRHPTIPRHLVTHCAASGVALLEVPRGVPFGAISRYVADQVASQEYSAIRHTMGVHDRLVKALTDGSGLTTMMEGLAEITAHDCCVVDFYGTVLAESSPHYSLPVEAVLDHRHEIHIWAFGDVCGYPVLLRGKPVATLVTRACQQDDEAVSQAVRLIALELAHQSELQVIRRQAIGLVLEDVFAGALNDQDAAEMLGRSGVDVGQANSVLVARAHQGSGAMLSSPWNLQVELGGRLAPQVLVAAVHRDLVVIVPDNDTAEGAAERLVDRLGPFVGSITVGVGNPYPEVGGLKLSYAEASAAAAEGPGVVAVGRLRLARLMVAVSQPGVKELAQQILRPLVDHDTTAGGELLETLEVLLDESGSSGRTAERLFIHRNTVGQRVTKIRQLTGFDPTHLPDATELFLALALRKGG